MGSVVFSILGHTWNTHTHTPEVQRSFLRAINNCFVLFSDYSSAILLWQNICQQLISLRDKWAQKEAPERPIICHHVKLIRYPQKQFSSSPKLIQSKGKTQKLTVHTLLISQLTYMWLFTVIAAALGISSRLPHPFPSPKHLFNSSYRHSPRWRYNVWLLASNRPLMLPIDPAVFP